MTADPAILRALLARVEAATGPDREIDELIGLHVPGAVYSVTGHYGEPLIAGTSERYTASLDAALALVERSLPGWELYILNVGEDAATWVVNMGPRGTFTSFEAAAPTPGLALLAALLRALIEGMSMTNEERAWPAPPSPR